MNKWFAQLEEPLRSAGSIMEKKIMRDFAHKFGLVYFGHINARSDDYELVRGVTLHAHHRDKHFIIGNYKGYDVSLLQRLVDLTHPNHGAKHYKWSIVQVDLQARRLPHILVTSARHDRIFLDNVKISLAGYQVLNPELIPDKHFAGTFRVYVATDGVDEVPVVLSPPIMAAMARHFKGFDVEMFDDQVIVYAHVPRVSFSILQEMLREALWLATSLDEPVLAAKKPADDPAGEEGQKE